MIEGWYGQTKMIFAISDALIKCADGINRGETMKPKKAYSIYNKQNQRLKADIFQISKASYVIGERCKDELRCHTLPMPLDLITKSLSKEGLKKVKQ